MILVVDVGLVVTVPVVGGVVVVVVVDDIAGSQILNTQYVGSRMGADSGPSMIDQRMDVIFSMNLVLLTTKYSTTCNTCGEKNNDTIIQDEKWEK